MNKKERDEKIELYGNGYDMLMQILKDVPQEMWQFKPEPREWSVHEILVHLADSESNAALRARMLIVEPNGIVMGYDEDKWAVDLNYHDQNYEDALEVVRLARKTTYKILKAQPNEVFNNSVKHPQYEEPFTFDQWLDSYSTHIPEHIEQIKNNYKIWKNTHG